MAERRKGKGGPRPDHKIDRSRPHLPIISNIPKDMRASVRKPFYDLFLQALRECGSTYPACVVANVSRSFITESVRDNIDGFRDRYREVQQDINDRVEAEIVRRGVEGWEEPVFQGGKQVGTIRKFSDQLLIFYAKARMPERYRDKYEGANLIAGDQYTINMVRNDVLNVISQLPEEELQRLAERGKLDGKELPLLEEGE